MITPRFTHISPTAADQLRRGFWLALLVGHAPALLRRSVQVFDGPTDDFSPAGFITLALACALFALKFLDLRCIRFCTDRRSLLALSLAAALVHWNILPQSKGIAQENDQHLVISQVLFASSFVSIRRIFDRLIRWATGSLKPHAPAHRPRWTALTELRFGLASILISPRAPRAPPSPL